MSQTFFACASRARGNVLVLLTYIGEYVRLSSCSVINCAFNNQLMFSLLKYINRFL